jgi:hypothetical protein
LAIFYAVTLGTGDAFFIALELLATGWGFLGAAFFLAGSFFWAFTAFLAGPFLGSALR